MFAFDWLGGWVGGTSILCSYLFIFILLFALILFHFIYSIYFYFISNTFSTSKYQIISKWNKTFPENKKRDFWSELSL